MVNEINAEQQHGVEKVGGQAVVDSSANYYHSLPNQNSGQYLSPSSSSNEGSH